MLYLRRFKTHNDWVERKLDLPYPVVSWELDSNAFNFGEVWNSFYMTYSVQDPGEIQILSDDFDISNLTDLYIDGERFDPKRTHYFNGGEYEIRFLVKRGVKNVESMFQDTPESLRPSFSGATSRYAKLRSLDNMFRGCSQIKSINLSGIDTTLVKSINNIFKDCPELNSVTMAYPIDNLKEVEGAFDNVAEVGTFYYNKAYDYTTILNILPPGWYPREISCCYAAGYWINEERWDNDYAWNNG